MREHSIITIALTGVGETGVNQKTNVCKQGQCGVMSVQTVANKPFCSIKYLVQNLVAIITRFFVSFIKIPVLFKISVLKKLYLVL